MKKAIFSPQKGKIVTVALTAIAASASLSARAQTVFSETFDPLSGAATVQAGYMFGDTTADSSGIVSGVGLGGTAAWQTVNTAASGANGFSGVGAQYQNGSITAATDSNLSDYTLSFYAMANTTGGNAPNLTITVQTWTGNFFGGTMTGSLTAGANGVGTVSLNSAYTLYTLNLGNTSVFQTMSAGFTPVGGTYQVAFQLNGGGATPYTETLDVDDLQLTINPVPEPGTITLCGLGLASGLAFLRRRKA